MLKVNNIRLGFANNSSSSHSILLVEQPDRKQDILPEEDKERNWLNFGWEEFVCASPEAKKLYFAAQLITFLRDELGIELATTVASGLLGISIDKILSVDRQSTLVFPTYSNGKLAVAFIKDLFDNAINDPNVIVVDGNDNEDIARDFFSKLHPWFAALPEGGVEESLWVRQEPYGWCLFNTKTGTKVRLTRTEEDKALPKIPELVDINITHQCWRNCQFCYQDSQYPESHADFIFLQDLARNLEQLNVFEVVLGGGEPTSHPKFIEILQAFRKRNIVPNFTTYNMDWLDNDAMVEAVKENVGSFASSCHTSSDIAYFVRKTLERGHELAKKAVPQSIIGVTPQAELERMVEFAESLGWDKYSLVGFKATGRGKNFKPVPRESYNLKALFKLHPAVRFSVDTVLLQQFPEISQKITCTSVEGTHSIYIDAVSKIAKPASYLEEKFDLGDNISSAQIEEIFKRIQQNGGKKHANNCD